MMQHIPQVEIKDVPAALPADLVVLDVREDDEWQAAHIEGAVHVPLAQLPHRFGELPPTHRVLVVCRVGARSAQATGFLQAQGLDAVNLVGGMRAWDGARRPMVADSGAAPHVI